MQEKNVADWNTVMRLARDVNEKHGDYVSIQGNFSSRSPFQLGVYTSVTAHHYFGTLQAAAEHLERLFADSDNDYRKRSFEQARDKVARLEDELTYARSEVQRIENDL